MHWNVEGADPRTGKEQVISIEAETREEAEQKARRKGLLVSAVYESSFKSPQDALDELAGAARARPVAGSVKSPPPSAPTAPIAYGSPSTRATSAPSYSGLQIGSSILMIFAMLYYIGAAVAVVGGCYLAAQETNARDGWVLVAASIIYALFSAMLGGLLHAASAACLALRDIARNSFR